MSNKGLIEVAKASSQFFSDANVNDVLLRTTQSNQKILLGNTSNSPAMMSIDNSQVKIAGVANINSIVISGTAASQSSVLAETPLYEFRGVNTPSAVGMSPIYSKSNIGKVQELDYNPSEYYKGIYLQRKEFDVPVLIPISKNEMDTLFTNIVFDTSEVVHTSPKQLFSSYSNNTTQKAFLYQGSVYLNPGTYTISLQDNYYVTWGANPAVKACDMTVNNIMVASDYSESSITTQNLVITTRGYYPIVIRYVFDENISNEITGIGEVYTNYKYSYTEDEATDVYSSVPSLKSAYNLLKFNGDSNIFSGAMLSHGNDGSMIYGFNDVSPIGTQDLYVNASHVRNITIPNYSLSTFQVGKRDANGKHSWFLNYPIDYVKSGFGANDIMGAYSVLQTNDGGALVNCVGYIDIGLSNLVINGVNNKLTLSNVPFDGTVYPPISIKWSTDGDPLWTVYTAGVDALPLGTCQITNGGYVVGHGMITAVATSDFVDSANNVTTVSHGAGQNMIYYRLNPAGQYIGHNTITTSVNTEIVDTTNAVVNDVQSHVDGGFIISNSFVSTGGDIALSVGSSYTYNQIMSANSGIAYVVKFSSGGVYEWTVLLVCPNIISTKSVETVTHENGDVSVFVYVNSGSSVTVQSTSGSTSTLTTQGPYILRFDAYGVLVWTKAVAPNVAYTPSIKGIFAGANNTVGCIFDTALTIIDNGSTVLMTKSLTGIPTSIVSRGPFSRNIIGFMVNSAGESLVSVGDWMNNYKAPRGLSVMALEYLRDKVYDSQVVGNLNVHGKVNGQRLVAGDGGDNTAYKLYVNGGAYATGSFTNPSDRRIKTNIEKIPDALTKLGKLNGYTFDVIGDVGRKTGLIAQEVLEVLPEAVDTSGDILGLSYGNIIGLLVEAIKELQERIRFT